MFAECSKCHTDLLVDVDHCAFWKTHQFHRHSDATTPPPTKNNTKPMHLDLWTPYTSRVKGLSVKTFKTLANLRKWHNSLTSNQHTTNNTTRKLSLICWNSVRFIDDDELPAAGKCTCGYTHLRPRTSSSVVSAASTVGASISPRGSSLSGFHF